MRLPLPGRRASTGTGRRARRPRPAALLAVTAGLALLLAGCGGGADDAGSATAPEAVSGGAAPQAGSDGVARGAADSAGSAAPAASGAGAKAGAPAAGEVKLVRTADVVVRVPKLAPAVARVHAVATALGGQIASESVSYGDEPGEPVPLYGEGAQPDGGTSIAASPGEAVIVLRVPEKSLDTALDRAGAIGTELRRSASSEDVTASLADLESREATAERSVRRVRALLDQAKNLQDVVTLESELSRREADLESLQAQRRALADRAAMSTLTVTLHTPETVAEQEDDDDSGFLSGLEHGWSALKASTDALLTVLGALLPFAVVFGLVGYLLWRFLPRRRQRPAPGPAPFPAGTPRPGAPPAPGGAPASAPAPTPAPAPTRPAGDPD